jgi:hypothetical protein
MGRLKLPDFKPYYRATTFNMVQIDERTNRSTEQNRAQK